MKRAENVVNAKLQHIFFKDDALCFEFAKSKGRQEGEEILGPWHLYANPSEPHICPVLALARYLFSYPEKSMRTLLCCLVPNNTIVTPGFY